MLHTSDNHNAKSAQHFIHSRSHPQSLESFVATLIKFEHDSYYMKFWLCVLQHLLHSVSSEVPKRVSVITATVDEVLTSGDGT